MGVGREAEVPCGLISGTLLRRGTPEGADVAFCRYESFSESVERLSAVSQKKGGSLSVLERMQGQASSPFKLFIAWRTARTESMRAAIGAAGACVTEQMSLWAKRYGSLEAVVKSIGGRERHA